MSCHKTKASIVCGFDRWMAFSSFARFTHVHANNFKRHNGSLVPRPLRNFLQLLLVVSVSRGINYVHQGVVSLDLGEVRNALGQHLGLGKVTADVDNVHGDDADGEPDLAGERVGLHDFVGGLETLGLLDNLALVELGHWLDQTVFMPSKEEGKTF